MGKKWLNYGGRLCDDDFKKTFYFFKYLNSLQFWTKMEKVGVGTISGKVGENTHVRYTGTTGEWKRKRVRKGTKRNGEGASKMETRALCVFLCLTFWWSLLYLQCTTYSLHYVHTCNEVFSPQTFFHMTLKVRDELSILLPVVVVVIQQNS